MGKYLFLLTVCWCFSKLTWCENETKVSRYLPQRVVWFFTGNRLCALIVFISGVCMTRAFPSFTLAFHRLWELTALYLFMLYAFKNELWRKSFATITCIVDQMLFSHFFERTLRLCSLLAGLYLGPWEILFLEQSNFIFSKV